ncbi:hypothetical protein COU75_02910 [Candidatus Peregrinibacteria bacterium CG10_big_fil_rev_8_21_14_0_10_42_8]|nr:MAG: hypothetical protein COU75_02910 [Candidatus Peregrinibacteria bacterium CG10_big_fil_rev_8_21_14_0_10_42_8]
MRNISLLSILLLSTLATPQKMYACSCMGYQDQEQQNIASYTSADVVIQGSVISEEEKGHSIIYTVSVEKTWKGQADAYIEVETSNNSAACGILIPTNESMVIFLNRYDNSYHTGLCSGTVPATSEKLITWLSNYNDSTEVEVQPKVDCSPYICNNGDQHPSCTKEGHQIQYIVNPCKFSDNEKEEVQVEDNTFEDVSSSHPNAKAINFVRNEGIVKGYDDGTYRPNQTINRAEFIKIIIASNFTQEAIDNCESEDLFSDVHQSDWFADYVCIGKNDNVISGYDDGSFGPEKPVNFAEAAKIVVNAFTIHTNPEDQKLSVWWKPYVFALSRIGGLPPSFTDPNQLLTRGEMAEIIFRVMTGM